jgi:hypothetical protein
MLLFLPALARTAGGDGPFREPRSYHEQGGSGLSTLMLRECGALRALLSTLPCNFLFRFVATAPAPEGYGAVLRFSMGAKPAPEGYGEAPLFWAR